MTGHGGNIYEKAKLFNRLPEELLDFSANINPLGLEEEAKKAIHHHIEQLIHYPDPTCSSLYDVVEKEYGIPKKCILFGNGAAELIYALCRMETLKRVLVMGPTFSEYALGAKAAGLPVTSFALQYEESSFKVPWDRVIRTMKTGDMLFLGNPNNPDGHLLSPKNVEAFLQALPEGAYLTIDESFIDFTDQSHTCRYLVKKYPSLIILHSFTKYLAIPGLRLGAMYGDDELIERLKKQVPTWSVNHLAQVFGTVALPNKEYRRRSFQLVQKEKTWLWEAVLNIHGFHPIAPSVNFMLIELEEKYHLQDLENFLGKEGILIRNATNYEGLSGTWMRIAVRTHQENCSIVHALQRYSEVV